MAGGDGTQVNLTVNKSLFMAVFTGWATYALISFVIGLIGVAVVMSKASSMNPHAVRDTTVTTAAPDVLGLHEAEAVKVLSAAGYRVELETARSVEPAGAVVKQWPGPNDYVQWPGASAAGPAMVPFAVITVSSGLDPSSHSEPTATAQKGLK